MKNLVLTIAALLSLNTFTTSASNSHPASGINPTNPTAVSSATVQASIKMNPTHNGTGSVQVLNTSLPFTISVADLSGKNVFEKTITGSTFDLDGIMTTSGIYIISIKQNDFVISSKTVIVNK